MYYFEVSVTCRCGKLTNIPEIDPPQFCAWCGESFKEQGLDVPHMISAEQERTNRKRDLAARVFLARRNNYKCFFRIFSSYVVTSGVALVTWAVVAAERHKPEPVPPQLVLWVTVPWMVTLILSAFVASRIAKRKYPEPTS